MRRFLAVAILLMFLPLSALAAPAFSTPVTPQSLSPQATVSVTLSSVLNFGGRIGAVEYSPDGRYLAVAPVDGPIQVLNATTLAVEATIATPPQWISVSTLAWSPKSDKLAAGYQGGVVAVWRAPSGAFAWAKSGLLFDVRGVSWSPDGRYVAAGIVHSIYIHWAENGDLNATLSLDYGSSQPAGLSWSKDSDFIALGQQAYSPTGAIVALFETKGWTKSLAWRWTGPGMDSVAFDGRARFLGVQLGGIRLEVWTVRNWTLFANITPASGLEQFAWTADGSRLALLETEPAAAPNTTQSYSAFEALHLGGGAANSSALAIHPDGRTVAVGYDDGGVAILAVAGDRFFDDRTPLAATTGDPLTFDVKATVSGASNVVWTDATGTRTTATPLSEDPSATGHFNATLTVPPDWQGPLSYHFEMPSRGLVSPTRLVRVTDNDPPLIASWDFTRTGASGETAVATATLADNVRLLSGTFQMAIDGIVVASSTAGPGTTLNFTLSSPVTPQNTSVRLDAYGVDDTGNGGPIFSVVIPLDDLTPPTFGADISEPGTAGGRVKLGIEARDERRLAELVVFWRELKQATEGLWFNFSIGGGGPTYMGTFPLGSDAVAVEYYFAARDTAGNSNQTAVRFVPVLDRSPPEVVIDLSGTEATTGDLFHLGLIARDNLAVASAVAYVQLNGGTAAAVSLASWAEYGDGAFEANVSVGATTRQLSYSFIVTDAEGNSISSGTKTLRVRDNDPAAIEVLNGALRTVAGESFTISVRVTDAFPVQEITIFYRRAGQSPFYTADIRAPAAALSILLDVSLQDLNITTLRDGRAVEFYLFARDASLNPATLGSAAEPLVLRVEDGVAPSARFVVLGPLVAGSLITFDASESEDDLGIAAYEWTVNDRAVGNTSTLQFRFDTPGDPAVKLVVRDASGKEGSRTNTLSIAPAPESVAGIGAASVGIIAIAVAAAAGAFLFLRSRKPKSER